MSIELGKAKTERKRNGALINYTFDNNQRVIVKDYVDNTKQRDIYYDYDLRGLQTVESFGAAVATSDRTAQKYDGFGNLITDFIYMGGVGRAVYSQYDLNNNRTRVTHTDTGTYFTYGFDGLNRMQVIYEGGGTRMLEMNYGQDGRRQRIYRRSGVSATNYTFSNGVQLSSINQDFPNNSYDLTNSFQYTASGQISQLTLGNSLYYYHGNDNRTGNYTVNGLNQYTYVGGATQGSGQPLAYDTNANLTNDGTLTYQYDDENRLISTNGSVVSSFTYDPRGRLFQTIINGTKTQYLYDGDALVAEYDTNGTLQRRYVHGDRVDEPLVQYNSSALGTTNWRYLHADHQGSIIAQSDVNGNVLNTLSYDSYGIPATGNTDRFGYTGQIWFKELGLFYYKARMYHPKLGRFMQNDPIGYKDDMDLYSYVGDDPINKTDPNGQTAVGINYDYYMVNTGLGFHAPLGHGGVLLVDDKTGKTKYYEFGRYDPNGKGIVGVKLPKFDGNIRNVSVPDAKIGKDGKPTEASLNKIYDSLSKSSGEGSKITADVHYDQDATKVEKSILDTANDPDRDKYGVVTNNCKDFRDDAVNNDKTKYDKEKQ